MRMIWRGTSVVTVLCVVFGLFVGCIGNGSELAGRDARPTTPESPLEPLTFSLSPSPSLLVPLPSSLVPPAGVEAELWQKLTAELERQLVELRGASRVGDGLVLRTVSTPPQTQRSGTLLAKTDTELYWGYYSNGDYDQNSEVNMADLTQLALHYMESALPFKFPVNSIQGVVDGDLNGEINLADITPIALNFQNNVEKYNLYRSTDPGDYPDAHDSGNGSAELFASVLLGSAEGDKGKERLQLTSAFPEFYEDEYFWVRPADNEGAEGIPSSLVGPYTNIYTLDGYVFMAGGGTDPLPGIPVDLSGDATQSTVTDENGYYSFEGLLNGDYTVTPTGDPYGYTPESIDATITNADKYLSPIYPAPVDIVHRWSLDDGSIGGLGVHTGHLKIDADGNVFITDGAFSSVDDRIYLLKYDMFGELLWSQVYDLPFGVNEIELFILPSGEMYLGGNYDLTGIFDRNAVDLYVMKLDSSGNLIWDFAYNYPGSGLIDHSDFGFTGYVDSEDNLHIQADSSDSLPEGEEHHEYMLTISPTGLLLEQARIIPSPGHESVRFVDFELDPMGGLLASGLYSGEVSTRQGLLVRMFPNGEIDWINHWGDRQVSAKEIRVGLDGNIYQFFEGHPPGNEDEEGFQLARYSPNGERDWEILCTTANDLRSQPHFALGPQGRLWFAGVENIPEALRPTQYAYMWSFQPGDGSLRSSRQWECDSFDIDNMNITQVAAMEVNIYGVVVLSGTTPASTGEWVDHAVTVQETDWEITHDDSFSFESDDPPAEWRELPVSQTADVGVLDPEVDGEGKTFIMFYRP